MTRTYRYVRKPDVKRYLAQGWHRSEALNGTHHGEYSVLMWRVE